MKPSNFPDRKNQRRKDVLTILKRKINKTEKDKQEIKVLESKVEDNMRMVRTKIRRSSRRQPKEKGNENR